MKKFYKSFFYVPKHAKIPDRVFKTRFALSATTMLACLVMLCSATYAYFTDQTALNVAAVKAASYTLSVSTEERNIGTSDRDNSVVYTCPLILNDEHNFILTNNGSAEKGFCIIEVDGKNYATVPILKSGVFEVSVVASYGSEISFKASWGESSSENPLLSGDKIEISVTEYSEYTVAEGVTIEQIAVHYGVSVGDILRFNGLSEITAGETIKIPLPQTYEPLTVTEEQPYDDGAQNGDDETEDEQGGAQNDDGEIENEQDGNEGNDEENPTEQEPEELEILADNE